MKNRQQLAEYFASLDFVIGAEIGVAQGNYAEVLLSAIPGLKLILVDSYEGEWSLLYAAAKQRFPELIRQRSLEAVQDIADNSLDFVFIDADHAYESVKADIAAWTPKVRPGGIVSGHDYYLTRQGNEGVIRAVNEYTADNNYELNFTAWDLDADEDNKQPCWYFLREG